MLDKNVRPQPRRSKIFYAARYFLLSIHAQFCYSSCVWKLFGEFKQKSLFNRIKRVFCELSLILTMVECKIKLEDNDRAVYFAGELLKGNFCNQNY